jgi:hypothetical protein
VTDGRSIPVGTWQPLPTGERRQSLDHGLRVKDDVTMIPGTDRLRIHQKRTPAQNDCEPIPAWRCDSSRNQLGQGRYGSEMFLRRTGRLSSRGPITQRDDTGVVWLTG